jgi:hypothetical protein
MTDQSNIAQADEPVEMLQTNTRIRADLKRRAEHFCVDHDTSLSALVNEGLELRLAELDREKE